MAKKEIAVKKYVVKLSAEERNRLEALITETRADPQPSPANRPATPCRGVSSGRCRGANRADALPLLWGGWPQWTNCRRRCMGRRAAKTIGRRVKPREKTVYRLTVLYPSKDGEAFDYDYYFGKHHKLVVSLLKPEGMVACQFDKGVSDIAGDNKPPYLAIAHLEFSSVDALQKAVFKHGQEIVADIANYTKIPPIMQINEIMAT